MRRIAGRRRGDGARGWRAWPARSYSVADISATQSVKFLDLVWASVLGWLVFADAPSRSTWVGGIVICASTVWIAQREARGGADPGQAGDSRS